MGSRRTNPPHRKNGQMVFDRTRHLPRDQAARASDASRPPKGRLILIGGAEDRQGEMTILKQVAARAHDGRLAVITAASSEPAEMWAMYQRIFQTLGVKDVVHVNIQNRDDAYARDKIALVASAKVVFFTGGDQIRITSHVGGSPICDAIRDRYTAGMTVAGTSAGTSCMS